MSGRPAPRGVDTSNSAALSQRHTGTRGGRPWPRRAHRPLGDTGASERSRRRGREYSRDADSPCWWPRRVDAEIGSVSKVEMAPPRPLIYKVLFPSISTLETPPPADCLWSPSYHMGAGDGRENGAETPSAALCWLPPVVAIPPAGSAAIWRGHGRQRGHRPSVAQPAWV